MTVGAEAVRALVVAYAERLDAGDLDGVAALFDHAVVRTARARTGLVGREAVRGLYDPVMRYEDGTPRTKHVLANLDVRVDEAAGTATSRCVFTVWQASPTAGLRPVLTGRYDDAFMRDGTDWHFTERVIHADLLGDLSSHMRLVAPAPPGTDAAALVHTLVRARLPASRPVVLGIAGGVAAGKTRLADDVRDALTGIRAEVVATDGFLLPNAELARRGLQARKGFPETYDADRLRDFVRAVRAGELPQTVPSYSHDTYDVSDTPRVIEPVDVLIIEGVNVLTTVADLLDVGVYLDAAEADLEGWYRDRFVALCAAGRDDPTSFYRAFADLRPEAIAALATRVCRDVNQVNLREHIAPSRDLAACVIVQGPDHEVLRVTIRDDDAASAPSAGS